MSPPSPHRPRTSPHHPLLVSSRMDPLRLGPRRTNARHIPIIHRTSTVHNPNGQMPFGQKFGPAVLLRSRRSVGRFSPPRTWHRSGCRTGRPEDERSLSWLRWGGEGLALLVVWVSADRSVRYRDTKYQTGDVVGLWSFCFCAGPPRLAKNLTTGCL